MKRQSLNFVFSFVALVFATENFIVDAPDQPLVDRNDGGHIVIDPKIKVRDRQQLTPSLAIELMRLTIITGEAMTMVMNRHGVDVGRVNYQDNGNWSVLEPEGPFMHIHLYGRAKSAKIQMYGQACYFPHRDENPEFYQNLKPLTAEDISGIRETIVQLLARPQFSNATWGLKS